MEIHENIEYRRFREFEGKFSTSDLSEMPDEKGLEGLPTELKVKILEHLDIPTLCKGKDSRPYM